MRFLDEYRGKEIPINEVFGSTHKENIKKARKAITPIVDTLKLCGRQNIPLRGLRTALKITQKLEKVVLLIQEIL